MPDDRLYEFPESIPGQLAMSTDVAHYTQIDVHWTGQCEARLDGSYLGMFASEQDARHAIIAKAGEGVSIDAR